MYGAFEETDGEKRIWLDRFLIDHHFQGKGLGKQMLTALIEHLKQIYDCERIYLSLYEDNTVALTLYQKFGFKFNGELDINQEKVMVKIL